MVVYLIEEYEIENCRSTYVGRAVYSSYSNAVIGIKKEISYYSNVSETELKIDSYDEDKEYFNAILTETNNHCGYRFEIYPIELDTNFE